MNRKFLPLDNYLKNSVEFATIRAKLQQNKGLFELVQGLLPHPLNGHCIGLTAKQDQLILFADSSAWASRLRFFSRDLIAKLKEKNLHYNKISIKIMIDNGKTKVKTRGDVPRFLSAKNSDLLRKVADHTSDPDLRAALLRLSSHRQRRE